MTERENQMPENSTPRTESRFRYWQQDFLASLVVFLVALPLCMGIALACGAPVATGLVTGIIGGIVVGVMSGSPLQVSGPAAGLTVICATVIREQGIPALGIVVLIAGILQLTAGLLRLGQWFRAVSPAVIHGMLSGIGVLILSSQIHVMVDDRPRETGMKNIITIPASIWKGLPLPSLEEPAARHARIELLQRFGQLRDEQAQISRNVARTVTQHGSQELRRREASALARWVPKQQRLVEDFLQLIETYRVSPIAGGDEPRTVSLRGAMLTAKIAMQAALQDLEQPRLETTEQSQEDAVAALGGVLAGLKSHDWAAKVGLLSIALILLWQFFARGRLRLIPAPLLAVLATTLLAWALSLPVLYVEVPHDLRDGLTLPTWTVFQDVGYRQLLVAGLVMAVIASAETLLCASAVDRMHSGPRTQYDRELTAQGIGNMLCGMAGALPMTGVIVRSAANVQAGARTRLSTILHGIWLLAFVVSLQPVLTFLGMTPPPVAALAGILVYTGFKLIDYKGFFRLWRESRSEAMIFLVTLVVIVVEDLLVGVVTGVILSAVKLLVTFSRMEVILSSAPDSQGRPRTTLAISGAATFLRLPQLASKLDQVPPQSDLHIDLQHLNYIDHACLELLMNWAKQHDQTGGKLVIDWDTLHACFGANGNSSGSRPDSRPDANGGRALPTDVETEVSANK